MSRQLPISRLAALARMWSSPAVERPVFWRKLVGGDRWAVLLITKGRKGELSPPPDRMPAPRLNPDWARRSGRELTEEELLYERASVWVRTYADENGKADTTRAVGLAVDALMDAVRSGEIDLTRLAAEATAEQQQE